MSALAAAPGAMLGYTALDARRAHLKAVRAARGGAWRRSLPRAGRMARWAATVLVIAAGLVGISAGSAQAFLWDDMKNDLSSTILNVCGPNDVPPLTTYRNIDTLLGLNSGPPSDPAMRATVVPSFDGYELDATKTKGNPAVSRLTSMYGRPDARAAKIGDPQYERYGFGALQWSQYGNSCFSAALVMGPTANMALIGLVHIPMILAMATLNIAMDNVLYDGFALMMQPFIGAMYDIFNPWIYFFVPIGIFIVWIGSKGSLQATVKAGGWGVLILSVFLLMGSSNSQFVRWATNVVTEVSGTAACKISAANTASQDGTQYSTSSQAQSCLNGKPDAAINQALWGGISYQTWLNGQVGTTQAGVDLAAANEGKVGVGPALLNGVYLGTDENGNIDAAGKKVQAQTERWNNASYLPDDANKGTKVLVWGVNNAWHEVPYLAAIKVICNDQDTTDTDSKGSESKGQRWMYYGARGQTDGDGGPSNYCDAAGGGTTVVPTLTGADFSTQLVNALAGSFGALSVALTVALVSIYLAFQKMLFFFLLFLAPIVLTVASIGDSKRRPFAIRYAELIGMNLLRQVLAVCVVLFVGYAMQALFLSNVFEGIPWMLKPYVSLIFFIVLLYLAFPMMGILKGAMKGDTSALDKAAEAPQRTAKAALKGTAIAGAAVVTGGAGLAAMGSMSGTASLSTLALGTAGGKAALLGRAGTALSHGARIAGLGSKTGSLMRKAGHLAHAGSSLMDSRATTLGKTEALRNAAAILMDPNSPTGSKYRGADGNLLPGAEKVAMVEASRLMERGSDAQRAAAARNGHMGRFFAAYEAKQRGTAQDVVTPEQPLPRAAAPAVQTGRPDDDPGAAGTTAGGPTTPNTPLAGTTAAVPFGAPGTGPDGTTPTPEEVAAHYAQEARNNLDLPVHARDLRFAQPGRINGENVLDNGKLTMNDVLTDPSKLLAGDMYAGGDTTKMDPFHPATPALTQLRFAAATGNPDHLETAMNMAGAAIEAHGIPSQIDSMHAIGPQAAAFTPIALAGAIPQVPVDATPEVRADAAQTMVAAAASMPVNYTARPQVEAYTAALSNPAVEAPVLETLRVGALDAVGQTMGVDPEVVYAQAAVPAAAATAAALPAAAAAGAVSAAPAGYGSTGGGGVDQSVIDAAVAAGAAAGASAAAGAQAPTSSSGWEDRGTSASIPASSAPSGSHAAPSGDAPNVESAVREGMSQALRDNRETRSLTDAPMTAAESRGADVVSGPVDDGGAWLTGAPSRGTSREAAPRDELVAPEGDDEQGVVFRPSGRRRKRSSFFQRDEEDQQGPVA